MQTTRSGTPSTSTVSVVSSLPTTKATRYVDIFMVGEKRMRRLSPTGSMPTTGEFEIASTSGVDDERDLEDGLAVGLVEAGEAPPGVDGLELGGGDGLRLAVGAGVGGAVEAAQLVVEGSREAAADRAGPGGSGAEGGTSTCSSSSSKFTVQGTVDPSAVRTSTSLTASSAALSTIASTASCTTTSMADGAREGGGSDVRLDLDAVGLGLDRAGQAEGLRAVRGWREGGA